MRTLFFPAQTLPTMLNACPVSPTIWPGAMNILSSNLGLMMLALMMDTQEGIPRRYVSQRLPTSKRHPPLVVTTIMPSGTCFRPSWLVSHQPLTVPAPLQRWTGLCVLAPCSLLRNPSHHWPWHWIWQIHLIFWESTYILILLMF